ncbi:hypothetical protein CTI12_AA180260 [Artemisia annua]|uniref:Uncharacterized protein n=1 Tax=Artemisia annua TaxID=35608 RepID=A0A2U1P8W9_ARTAN|nr:hypothetical protein CTI12_AA180260 [Artemisia annua]
MRKASKDNAVIKLVRPGGIVELYKHPIKAAQVMERYPRHFVTPPDVFRFPNIVVKPESVLKPGEVFYIVPYHTIYRLLQSKGYRSHSRRYTQTDHNEAFKKKTLENVLPKEEVDDEIISVEEIRNNKQSNRQDANPHVKEKRLSCVLRDGTYDSDEALDAAAGCFPIRRKGVGVVEANKDTAPRNGFMTCLKPCLKKQRNNKPRSQQGPRVRFTLPEEDDDNDYDVDFTEFQETVFLNTPLSTL